jgi:hypothetical protein
MYYEEKRIAQYMEILKNNIKHHIQRKSHLKSIPIPDLGSILGPETGHAMTFLVSSLSIS